MSDAPVEAPEAPVEPSLAEPEVSTPEEPQRANKEARYRVERNAARESLEAATATIEKLQKAAIENLASVALAKPGDLFALTGKSVSDYVNEDGFVVPDLVSADIAEILNDRPLLKRTDPAYDPSQNLGSPKKVNKPSWASLLH